MPRSTTSQIYSDLASNPANMFSLLAILSSIEEASVPVLFSTKILRGFFSAFARILTPIYSYLSTVSFGRPSSSNLDA